MNDTGIFVILGVLMLLLLGILHLLRHMEPFKRFFVLFNILACGYEIFFFAAVCGAIPHAQVHFGGGLGDLLYFFILILLIPAHIITLLILIYKVKRAIWLLVPLVVVFFLLSELHSLAARGNWHNGYMVGGNFAGLYYDAGSVHFRDEVKAEEPDFATEFESLLYDAGQGSKWAQHDLGLRYIKGEGVEKNDTLAVKWFTMAAESGLMYAQSCLANCYYEGLGGLEVDYPKAVEWYRKSAEQGLDYAQYRLGRCYGNGVGVEKNEEEAFKWLRMAARQDYEEAQELLKANGQTW